MIKVKITRFACFNSLFLNLFNKVFVRYLGETSTFIGVEVDVINIE